MRGDHTPLILSDPSLTPLGAHQMYAQGAAFRNRYIRPARYDQYVGTVGISRKVIDNSQLHIESSADRCSSASALAFMQGAYPPIPHVSCDTDVPKHNWLADGTVINYPMCGYQYPNIQTTAPERDSDSIWYSPWSKPVPSRVPLTNISTGATGMDHAPSLTSRCFCFPTTV